ncbi:MAG TPA: hypothetical protein VIB59_01875 [Solirubrobacteraceae bacterium]|jgi:hypothetical protein
MTRLTDAWAALDRERRIAAIAAIALLVTMFLPWYGLQSLNRKTGVIHSHNINAFGDVSFVEAAIFLVAVGVLGLLLARAEGRNFNMPGGDGTIVALAGGWAAVLIFYRVFDRPGGNGYPVGVQWGFFLAFVAAGSLAYAGWRMRAGERPAAPVRRRRPPGEPGPERFEAPSGPPGPEGEAETDQTPLVPVGGPPRADAPGSPAASPAPRPSAPARSPAGDRSAEQPSARRRPRYPPAPGEPEQLSFEDAPPGEEH